MDIIWLPIPGWEDLYEISTMGEIRSLKTGRLIAPYIQGGYGYLCTGLSRNGVTYKPTVHSLVARTFLGPLPEGLVTRHGPGGKLDNRLENLSYGTQAENVQDMVRDGTRVHGEQVPQSVLTDAIVAECRRRYRNRHAEKVTYRSLGDEFGVTQATMMAAVRGITWSHVEEPPVDPKKDRKPRPAAGSGCGTNAGYFRHRKAGEQACEDCADAHRSYHREYYRTKVKPSRAL